MVGSHLEAKLCDSLVRTIPPPHMRAELLKLRVCSSDETPPTCGTQEELSSATD